MDSQQCSQNRDSPHREFNTGLMRTRVLSETDPDYTAPNRGLYPSLPHKTQVFLSVTNIHGLLADWLLLFPPRQSDPMESEPPSRLVVSVLFACTRVDTCHPGNYMCSSRTPFFHHLGITGLSKGLRINSVHMDF
jgi:hypothetical protein